LRKVSALAAIAKRMVHEGLAGKPRAIDQLLKVPGVLGTGDGTASIPDSKREPLTAGDRSILERYKQRVIEEHKLSADAVDTDETDDKGGATFRTVRIDLTDQKARCMPREMAGFRSLWGTDHTRRMTLRSGRAPAIHFLTDRSRFARFAV
jgi:hypothetical protein